MSRTLWAVVLLMMTASACGTTDGTDGGATGGGSTAGGSAGGVTAGGTAGGSVAGGTAGGSVAGGTAGGSVAGGTAGGSVAGGSVAGGSAGGSVAGGTAGGSVAGGSAGGSSAGGAAGGATAGGAGGGTPNRPPVINGIVFTRVNSTVPLNPPVFAGQVVRLNADVLDPEGQPLTITWSIDGGTLSDPMMETPTWYSDEVTRLSAPFPAWDIRLEVSDGVNPPVSFTQPLSVRSPSFVNDVVRQGVLGSTAFNGCANSGCHGNALTPSALFAINPNMTSALHTALLADHNKVPTCSIAMRRVQAFNPMGSLLYRKLLGGLPVACGAQMPYLRGPVAPNELVTIRSWINAGALQN